MCVRVVCFQVVDVETSLLPSSACLLTNAVSCPDTTASSHPDLGTSHTSLLSLHGSGLAGGPPSQLSAGAHAAAGPLIVEEVQSLHVLCKILITRPVYTCTCTCTFEHENRSLIQSLALKAFSNNCTCIYTALIQYSITDIYWIHDSAP